MADIKKNKDGSSTVTITVSGDVPDALRDQLVRQLERGGGSALTVGNLADVQRAGAVAVAGGKTEFTKGSGFDAGVALNPNQDEDAAKAGAERVIDEEKEAKSAPEAATPSKPDEPLTPKDPTSQSPQPAKK